MSAPPFFDHVCVERACSRAIDDNGQPCGQPPFLHVAWRDTPAGMEVGWVCTRHASELAYWKPLQAHEPGPDCGMPGALWYLDENLCRCPDGGPPGEVLAADSMARMLA